MENKKSIFKRVRKILDELNFSIVAQDHTRPWGGFFVLDEDQASQFAAHYFPEVKFSSLKITSKLSPKILLVAPNKRLSWQYHHRRAELWKCIDGEVAVITSEDDQEKEQQILQQGDIIKLKQGERHRLIGLDDWGIVAEIWQHTNNQYPSDENDIIRLQDDFGR